MEEKRLDEVILDEAIEARATDIHIDPLIDGYSVRIRVDGKLRLLRSFDKEAGERLLNQIKANVGIDSGVIFYPVNEHRKLNYSNRLLDLRVSLVPCISGPKLSIRILETANAQQKLSTLGITDTQTDEMKRWLFDLNGMFMVTGPTGSGKTTTLYALLHELVEESRHVVTVEDPVEYEIDGINQVEVDLNHGLTFAKGLKNSLRMDPDCLMVGEISDSETAHEAINAAVMGHVMMATMHSRDAVSTITRLRDLGLENHQIGAALGVVVNQRLVGKVCQSCSSKRDITPKEAAFFESRSIKPPRTTSVASGCSDCSNTVIGGRTGIFEVWNLDTKDYKLILAGADEDKIRSRLLETGHISLLANAISKVEAGLISADEVMYTGMSLPWMNK